MEVENDGKQQAFLTEPSTMLLNVYNDNKMCINQMKAIFTWKHINFVQGPSSETTKIINTQATSV